MAAVAAEIAAAQTNKKQVIKIEQFQRDVEWITAYLADNDFLTVDEKNEKFR